MRKAIGRAETILVFLLIIIMASGIAVFKNREEIACWLYPEMSTANDSNNLESKINIDYIKEEIKEIAELQTAEVTYGCIANFEDGKIVILNKKSFKMYYEVTVYASININDIECIEKDGKYIITLPASEANIVDIDPNSLKFYDKSGAILNWTKLEDVKMALSYAEDDAKYQASTIQMLKVANKNAVDIISNLLNTFLDKDAYEIISSKDNTNYVRPPMSYEDVVGKNVEEVKEAFIKSGYTNIQLVELKDVTSVDIRNKENTVESVTINDRKTFLTSNAYPSDSTVTIQYHVKKK